MCPLRQCCWVATVHNVIIHSAESCLLCNLAGFLTTKPLGKHGYTFEFREVAEPLHRSLEQFLGCAREWPLGQVSVPPRCLEIERYCCYSIQVWSSGSGGKLRLGSSFSWMPGNIETFHSGCTSVVHLFYSDLFLNREPCAVQIANSRLPSLAKVCFTK